jgi:hypothetical protein
VAQAAPEPVKEAQEPDDSHLPLHKRKVYIEWHRACHIPEAHFIWCRENGIPYQPQPNEQ